MKLNWFSPLPPAETEIAHYTTRILPALRERAEVVLWTDQTAWSPILEDYVEVRCFQPEQISWADINRADMSIYHIGNHPLYHGSIWQASRRHPGIIILHEFRLQHLFAGLYKDQWADREGYVAEMGRQYGETGRLDAKSFWDSEYSTEAMAEKYPLTSLAVENSLGVLVHTREAFNLLKKERPWPVAYAPLPYPASPYLVRSGSEVSRSGIGGPPYRLIVFGYLGLNRRLDALLQAFGEFPERDRFRLDIYGQLWHRDHVRAQIHAHGLERLVTLHDFVPEAELNDALASAHLAINLRYPTMGEASAGQLRAWDHALPSLVTSVGWYAGLPKNTVSFIRPEHEIIDIQDHLRAFLADPAHFAAMGENGRRFLEEHHAPAMYVQAIMEFAVSTQRHCSHIEARTLAEQLGAEMGAWTSPTLSGDLSEKVGSEIYTLVLKAEEQPLVAIPKHAPGGEPYKAFSKRIKENLQTLQRNWNGFGWAEPFGALLALSGKRPSEGEVAEFLKTGDGEVSSLMQYVSSLKKDMSRKRALDFGCGVGRITQALYRYFEECVGIDGARSMIELANQFNQYGTRCRYHLNESNDLKLLDDNMFDFIYANLVFQHVKPEYSKNFLKEFIRILAPGGLIVFQLPSERLAVEHQVTFDRGAMWEPMRPSGLRARIALMNTPSALTVGSRSVLRAQVKNSSDRTWPAFGADDGTYQIKLGNRWRGEGKHLVVNSDGRATLPKDLKPMHLVELPLVIATPEEPGRYILELDMVQEGVIWFGDKGSEPARVRVTVGNLFDRLFRVFQRGMSHSRFTGELKGSLPPSEVYGIHKQDVMDFIGKTGGRVVDVQENDLAGKGWRAFHYCVTKD